MTNNTVFTVNGNDSNGTSVINNAAVRYYDAEPAKARSDVIFGIKLVCS